MVRAAEIGFCAEPFVDEFMGAVFCAVVVGDAASGELRELKEAFFDGSSDASCVVSP